MSRIYLDHAATTPLRPEAREAMQRGFEIWANPSSAHRFGQRARHGIDVAREQLAALVNVDPNDIWFAGGGTEIVNTNIRTLLATVFGVVAFAGGAQAADKLVIAATPVPHAELLEFVKPMLAKEGVELEVKVFTDYVQPSMQTNEKRVDGNFFLHLPYLNEFKKKHRNDIQTVVAKVHV